MLRDIIVKRFKEWVKEYKYNPSDFSDIDNLYKGFGMPSEKFIQILKQATINNGDNNG